jgi:hypothetical protein
VSWLPVSIIAFVEERVSTYAHGLPGVEQDVPGELRSRIHVPRPTAVVSAMSAPSARHASAHAGPITRRNARSS